MRARATHYGLAAPLVSALALAACSSATVQEATQVGTPPLCSQGRALGAVLVVAETRWRPDQKEPALRQAMAQRAIESAVDLLPCGQVIAVTPIGASSQQTNAEMLANNATAKADTLIRVRAEELGPQLIISIPVLWRVNSDAKMHVTALDARTGATLLEVEHRRTVGGPFTLRPAAMAEGEFATALRHILVGREPHR